MFSPSQLATYFVLSATAATYCLIAIWAATSRRHWLVRATFRLWRWRHCCRSSHEPLIYFALVMSEIAALLFLGRWIGRLWHARPPLTPSWFRSDAWQRRLSRLHEVFPTFARMAAALVRNEGRQKAELAPSRMATVRTARSAIGDDSRRHRGLDRLAICRRRAADPLAGCVLRLTARGGDCGISVRHLHYAVEVAVCHTPRHRNFSGSFDRHIYAT